MSWDGYFTFDGREFINVARTEAYADAADAYWFRNQIEPHNLAGLLGDSAYTDPATDDAPWYDPDRPESAEFIGFYPLNVDGLDSSSRQSEVVESTGEGGVPGKVRHGTKSLVFNGLLLATTHRGAEYGSRWLRRTLLGAPCSPRAHDYGLGTALTYLAAPPSRENGSEGDPAEMRNLRRTYLRASVNVGPTVTGKREISSCGGQVWMVTFTATIGNPFAYGDPLPILTGWMDPLVANPWAPTATDGTISAAATFVEVECGEDVWAPIYDPLCAAVIEPPAPPSLPLGCFTPPVDWTRQVVVIPAENIPLWDAMVPIVEVTAVTEVRNLRIRIYDDPSESLDPDATPCAWSADMVIGYIPEGATLTIDGMREEVWVETSTGALRRADTLVFATDGTPFQWPMLSCGSQQQVTVDFEDAADDAIISLSFVPQVV